MSAHGILADWLGHGPFFALPVRATAADPQLLLLDALSRPPGGEVPIHD
ncbi:MAG: hypothetical protein U0768_06620 [Anaerolineae bacterium]